MEGNVYEPIINGKRVKFKERLLARDHFGLPQKLREASSREGGRVFYDPEHMPPVLAQVIEEWEFDGDPGDVEAYGDLELYPELMPLIRALDHYIAEVTGAGEAEGGPTSE